MDVGKWRIYTRSGAEDLIYHEDGDSRLVSTPVNIYQTSRYLIPRR
jgi:hypothetical protein